MRSSGYRLDRLRSVTLIRKLICHAEDSVLVCFGDTRILYTTSMLLKVLPHKKGSGEGWVTARYSMLLRSAYIRSGREATRGKQSGRTQEIQCLIGRTMRTVFGLRTLGEYTLYLDCDVLQTDGGTRMASVIDAFVVVYDAVPVMYEKGQLVGDPVRDFVATVSIGVVDGVPMFDLDYSEDSACDTDMNVVMIGSGGFVKVQGIAEGALFSRVEMDAMLGLAGQGIRTLISLQKQALGL